MQQPMAEGGEGGEGGGGLRRGREHKVEHITDDLGIGFLFFTTSTVMRMPATTELVPVHGRSSWHPSNLQMKT